jgi:hypothetical protein
MADFVARIRAELDTSGVLSQLKNLTKDQTVNVKINLTGATNISGQLQNLFSGATSSASNAGAQAGKAFSNAMQRSVNSIEYKFKTNKFGADNAQFKQMLDRYEGQTSSLLQNARKFQAEYEQTFSEIGEHFNGVNTLDDKTLVAKFKTLQQSADSFKNTMREVNTVAS